LIRALYKGFHSFGIKSLFEPLELDRRHDDKLNSLAPRWATDALDNRPDSNSLDSESAGEQCSPAKCVLPETGLFAAESFISAMQRINSGRAPLPVASLEDHPTSALQSDGHLGRLSFQTALSSLRFC